MDLKLKEKVVLVTGAGAGIGRGTALFFADEGARVVAADVNRDGRADLVTANYCANTLTVLTNNGSCDFGLMASPGTGAQPWAVAVADINGDGRADVV